MRRKHGRSWLPSMASTGPRSWRDGGLTLSRRVPGEGVDGCCAVDVRVRFAPGKARVRRPERAIGSDGLGRHLLVLLISLPCGHAAGRELAHMSSSRGRPWGCGRVRTPNSRFAWGAPDSAHAAGQRAGAFGTRRDFRARSVGMTARLALNDPQRTSRATGARAVRAIEATNAGVPRLWAAALD
jgi:hypothetical protein